MQEMTIDIAVNGLMDFGQVVSYILSLVLVLISVWGIVAFFPKKNERTNSGPGYLVFAIWLGFLGVGLNVFYWRVFGDIAVSNGWITIFQLRNFGNSFGDIIWRGLGVISIYFHFYARWKSINPKERKHWTPLMMGFYPNIHNCLVRTLTFWKNRARDEFYHRDRKQQQDQKGL